LKQNNHVFDTLLTGKGELLLLTLQTES
jgi:hypothetical protein